MQNSEIDDFALYLEHVDFYNSRWLNKDKTFYLAKLMEEAGEVAEASIVTMYGSVSKAAKLAKVGDTGKDRLTEEIGDMLNVLLTLAMVNDISRKDIFTKATAKIATRIKKKQSQAG